MKLSANYIWSEFICQNIWIKIVFMMILNISVWESVRVIYDFRNWWGFRNISMELSDRLDVDLI